MSYRIRFTLPDGRTGLWAHDYPTREEAQRAIDDRQGASGLAYSVEEVVTPEARIRDLEAELAQLRDAYDAAVQDRDAAVRKVTSANLRLDCSLTNGNRLRNVMRMLRSPDEETRLLASRRADEWDELVRITTDSRNASKAWSEEPITVERQGPAKASDESKDTP